MNCDSSIPEHWHWHDMCDWVIFDEVAKVKTESYLPQIQLQIHPDGS